MDLRVFREESIFQVELCDFLVFEKYMQALMEHPHALKSSRPDSLDKLYFFQDVWFFLQFGKAYKTAIISHSVTLKDVRLSFLEFLVTLEEVENAQTLRQQERFIFCYRFLTELFSYSRKRVREESALKGLRDDYYNAIEKETLTNELQQKVITSYYSEWFKQGYLLSKLFQEKLAELNKVCFAIQEVCGLFLNESNQNLSQFVQAVMKADELLEITFWKRKFKEQGLPTLFEHNGDQQVRTIVVCLQQSEKMRPLIRMQIGLICAMLAISEEEACNLIYIPYTDQISKELYCEKGQVTVAQYMDIVQQFLGGDGEPNYRQLLNVAFTMLKLSTTSSGGEIVIMCDDIIGEFVPQDPLWKKAVLQYKEEMNIRIIVLHSGSFNEEIAIWFADRIMFIEDFQTKMKMM